MHGGKWREIQKRPVAGSKKKPGGKPPGQVWKSVTEYA
jgi:hypothetical protein